MFALRPYAAFALVFAFESTTATRQEISSTPLFYKNKGANQAFQQCTFVELAQRTESV